jgi:GT2 family glycosyltransferase
MILTVIIVNYKTEHFIERLMTQLVQLNAEFKSSFEIIVVDNDDKHAGFEIEESGDCQITVLSGMGNIGFSRANNLGASKATGKYLLFVNPDVILNKFKISSMVKILEENEEIGILSPLIRDDKGRIQGSSFGRFPGIVQSASDFLFWNLFLIKFGILFKGDEKDPIGLRSADWVSGTCMLVRKSVFDLVHGFDETIFMYYEDVDLCRRINRLGYRCAIWKGADITHLGGDYANNNFFSARRSSENRYYILRKDNKRWYVMVVALFDFVFNVAQYLLWVTMRNKHNMTFCKINFMASLKAISKR